MDYRLSLLLQIQMDGWMDYCQTRQIERTKREREKQNSQDYHRDQLKREREIVLERLYYYYYYYKGLLLEKERKRKSIGQRWMDGLLQEMDELLERERDYTKE